MEKPNLSSIINKIKNLLLRLVSMSQEVVAEVDALSMPNQFHFDYSRLYNSKYETIKSAFELNMISIMDNQQPDVAINMMCSPVESLLPFRPTPAACFQFLVLPVVGRCPFDGGIEPYK